MLPCKQYHTQALPRSLTATLTPFYIKQEYADESKLRGLVSKYSEFINFPIYMEVCTHACMRL